MTTYRLCPLVAIATAAFALGCGNERPEKNTPAVIAPAAAPPPAVPNDKSLTTAEYVQLGMPTPDRVWTGRDMDQARKVVSKLAGEDASKLPRYESPRSGKVFARITNPDALASFNRPELTVEERLRAVTEYANPLTGVLMVYMLADPGGQTLASEHVELFGISLRAAVLMVPLTEAYLLTIDPNDPTYPTRQIGREGMRQGLAKTINHLLKLQTETRAFTESDRGRFLSYTEETLPALYVYLPDATKTEVPGLLRDMEANPKLAFAKDRLRALREKLVAK